MDRGRAAAAGAKEGREGKDTQEGIEGIDFYVFTNGRRAVSASYYLSRRFVSAEQYAASQRLAERQQSLAGEPATAGGTMADLMERIRVTDRRTSDRSAGLGQSKDEEDDEIRQQLRRRFVSVSEYKASLRGRVVSDTEYQASLRRTSGNNASKGGNSVPIVGPPVSEAPQRFGERAALHLAAATPLEAGEVTAQVDKAFQDALKRLDDNNKLNASETLMQELRRNVGSRLSEDTIKLMAYRWWIENRYKIGMQLVAGVGTSLLLNAMLPWIGVAVPGFSLLGFLADKTIGGSWMWSFVAGVTGVVRSRLGEAIVATAKSRAEKLAGNKIPDYDLLGPERVQHLLEAMGVAPENRTLSLKYVLEKLMRTAVTGALSGKMLDPKQFAGYNWYAPTMDPARWRGLAYSTVAKTWVPSGQALKGGMQQLDRGIRRMAAAMRSLPQRLRAAYAKRKVLGRAQRLAQEVLDGTRRFSTEDELRHALAQEMAADELDPRIVEASHEAFQEVLVDMMREVDAEMDEEDEVDPVPESMMEFAVELPGPPPAVAVQTDELRFNAATNTVLTSLIGGAVSITGALLISRMAPGNFEAANELLLSPLGRNFNAFMQDIANNSDVRVEALAYQLIAKTVGLDQLIIEYAGKLPLHRIEALIRLNERIKAANVSAQESGSMFSRELFSILIGTRLYTRQELLDMSMDELGALWPEFFGPVGIPAGHTHTKIIDDIMRSQQGRVKNVHNTLAAAIASPVVSQGTTAALAYATEQSYAAAKGLYAGLAENVNVARLAGIAEGEQRAFAAVLRNAALDPLGAFRPGATASHAMRYVRFTGDAVMQAAASAKEKLDGWISRNMEQALEKQAFIQRQQNMQATPLSAPPTQQALADLRAIENGFRDAADQQMTIDHARDFGGEIRVSGQTFDSYTSYMNYVADNAARAADRDAEQAARNARRDYELASEREAELERLRKGDWADPAARGENAAERAAKRLAEQTKRAADKAVADAVARAEELKRSGVPLTDAELGALTGADIIYNIIVSPGGFARPVVGSAAPQLTTTTTPTRYGGSDYFAAPSTSPAGPAPAQQQQQQQQPTTPAAHEPSRPTPKQTPANAASMEELDEILWDPLSDVLARQGLQTAENIGAHFLGRVFASASSSYVLPVLAAIPGVGAPLAAGAAATMAAAPDLAALYRYTSGGVNKAADIYAIARAVARHTDLAPDSKLKNLPEINYRLPELGSLTEWIYNTETMKHMEQVRKIDVRAEVVGAVAEYTAATLAGNKPSGSVFMLGLAGRLMGPPIPGIAEAAAEQFKQATISLARSLSYVSGIEWAEP